MRLSGLRMGLAVLVLSPVVSFAAPGDAGTGIAATAHDFTSNGVNGSTAVGLCTYCHTPHKAITSQLLWNHTLSTNTFSWDVAKTTAGTTFPSFVGNTYKGPTAKCLSCHDGSVAIGDIAWFKEGSHGGSDQLSTKTMNDVDPNFVVGATGGVGGAMKGNHPVAMPYPFGNAASTYNGTTTGSLAVLTEWQADPTSLASANIRLFNDDGTGGISAGPVAAKTGIECSTCHDPHNKAAVDDLFLRGKITGSAQSDGYLCLQCHKK
ncbi:MAG: hypothetical protein HY017_25970 [Betaproteobacteria bacterium]|nr:hypothetical protein [Betaproteobacteria bacterium]